MTSDGMDVEKLDPCSLLVGMEKGQMQNNLAAPQNKIQNYGLAQWLSMDPSTGRPPVPFIQGTCPGLWVQFLVLGTYLGCRFHPELGHV